MKNTLKVVYEIQSEINILQNEMILPLLTLEIYVILYKPTNRKIHFFLEILVWIFTFLMDF